MVRAERFAWVWLTALVVVFSGYFIAVEVALRGQPELPIVARLGMLAIALTTLAVVVGIDRLVAWMRARGQEPEVADERDRLIELRSTKAAYGVLMVGVLVCGVVMPFSNSGWELVHAALLAVAISEIVHHGLILHGYHRGVRA